jgi:hypothetical protein
MLLESGCQATFQGRNVSECRAYLLFAQLHPSALLNHFIVALAEPAFVKGVYAEKLGFTIFPGAKRPGRASSYLLK